MPNYNLRLKYYMTDQNFRNQLKNFLRNNSSIYALTGNARNERNSCFEKWIFKQLPKEKISEMEAISKYKYCSDIFIKDPYTIKDLSDRLNDPNHEWPKYFEVKVPNFTPVPLPTYIAPTEYVNAINELRAYAAEEIFLGDACPSNVGNSLTDVKPLTAFPLADRIDERLKQLKMRREDMIGSTFYYSAKPSQKQNPQCRWSIRLVLEVFHEGKIFITDMSLRSLYRDTDTDYVSNEDYEKKARLSALHVKLSDLSTRIYAVEHLRALNASSAKGFGALRKELQELDSQMKRTVAIARAQKTYGDH